MPGFSGVFLSTSLDPADSSRSRHFIDSLGSNSGLTFQVIVLQVLQNPTIELHFDLLYSASFSESTVSYDLLTDEFAPKL